MTPPLNECAVCGCDFSSLTLFDLHRVGKHAYMYSKGIAMEPMREDGRRCLDADEMAEKGWEQNDRGKWIDPVRVEAARAGFARATA